MTHIPTPDNHRLRVLYAEPHQIKPEEVRHMAEEISELRKKMGIKTMLDDFAMAALTGVIENVGSANPRAVASVSYEIAQAMMEIRRK